MRLRLLGFATVTVFVVTMATVGAAAQTASGPCAPGQSQYPPSACGLTLSASVGSAGDSLTVRGAGYAGNGSVSIEFRSQPVTIGTARADGTGAFITTVAVPANATAGTHTVAGVGTNPNGSVRELTAQFVVQSGAPVVSNQSQTLPATGSGSSVRSALVGAGLVALGAAAVGATRARRRRSVST